jgi:hypothetical protein
MSSRGDCLPGAATRSRGRSAAGGGQRRGDRVRRRFQDRSPRGDDGDDQFAEHLIFFPLARPGPGTHPSGDGSGPRSAHGADLLFLTLGDPSHAEINSACPGDFADTGRPAAVAGTIALAGGHYQEAASRWERALVRRSPRSTATGASPVPAPAGGRRSPRRICPRRARLIPADCRPAGSASLSLRAAAHRGRAAAHHRR